MKPKHNKNIRSNEHFDGQKIEEHKVMDRKLTSSKSRWSWQGHCPKWDCIWSDTMVCDSCFKYDQYESAEK